AAVGSALHRLPERDRQGPSVTATAPVDLVGLEAVRAAAERLRGITVRTPLVPFAAPPDRLFVKAENLQSIGAFKLRGAYNAIASLPEDERARGVITYSSGNHAQGVARAARLLGTTAVIVMPDDAPAIKRARVAADGAEIVVVGPASDERQARAEAIAAERGLAIIPPFDDDRIIAGQGTAGLEILDDLPTTGLVLVPVGGGGLASGIATAVKALRTDVRVVGVEPELAADARDSLARGEIVRWEAADVSRTIADGTRTQALGRRTFAHLAAYLDGIVTVSEAEIAAAVRLAAERARLVVEPSGALAIAAAVFCRGELEPPGDADTVAVASGGNVDPDAYRRYLEAPLPG
ncbi:MAG TPA: threonine/serine dehydratase, partial [Candidatus Limnocylindrales bacterium]|nr:threonine/serine dehydratase [Candidatus Limnocylindrales bacterium]